MTAACSAGPTGWALGRSDGGELHCADPAEEYAPAGQSLQDPEPADEYLPAGQFMHEALSRAPTSAAESTLRYMRKSLTEPFK